MNPGTAELLSLAASFGVLPHMRAPYSGAAHYEACRYLGGDCVDAGERRDIARAATKRSRRAVLNLRDLPQVSS